MGQKAWKVFLLALLSVSACAGHSNRKLVWSKCTQFHFFNQFDEASMELKIYDVNGADWESEGSRPDTLLNGRVIPAKSNIQQMHMEMDWAARPTFNFTIFIPETNKALASYNVALEFNWEYFNLASKVLASHVDLDALPEKERNWYLKDEGGNSVVTPKPADWPYYNWLWGLC